MADTADVRQPGIHALVQDHFGRVVRSNIFNRMPAMYFFFGKQGEKKGYEGLGIPDTSVFVSGVPSAIAKREEILAATTYEPIIQTRTANESDGKALAFYDTQSSRANWQDNGLEKRLARPAAKFFARQDPYEISKRVMNMTMQKTSGEVNSMEALGSIIESEMKDVMGVHTRHLNRRLWGTTGAGFPSDETADLWDAPHSFQSMLRDDNLCCGVDRSQPSGTYFQGNYITDPLRMSCERLVDYIRYSIGPDGKGLDARGCMIDVVLCDEITFQQAKNEAKSKGEVPVKTGLPEFGQFGFTRELVKIDDVWFCRDPECPSGHAVGLTLGTWTLAIRPWANFTTSEPFDNSKLKRGDQTLSGNIDTEFLLICEDPPKNVYMTDVHA